MTIRNLFSKIRNFAKDNGGMEALQTVCIVAIAATILIAAATMGQQGQKWMTDNFTALKDSAKVDEAGTGSTTGASAEQSQETTPTP